MAASNISQKGALFWKKKKKKENKTITTPYSIPFLSVLFQNKALHNLYRRGQHLIARHVKGPDVWKFSHKLFWDKKYQLWLCPNDIYTFWLLITLCNMPKGLLTLQGKQQQPCIHLLYESLVRQYEYTAQP